MDTFLDYILDTESIEEEKKYNLLNVSPLMLAFSHFEVPVRISIGGVDILDWSGYRREALNTFSEREKERMLAVENNVRSQAPPGWFVLALLNVAWYGTNTILSIGAGDQVDFTDDDSGVVVHFTRIDDRIHTRSNLNDRLAIAPYNDVVQAFQAYSRRVRDEIVRDAPILTEHPLVGDWFAGRVDSPPALTS